MLKYKIINKKDKSEFNKSWDTLEGAQDALNKYCNFHRVNINDYSIIKR